MQSFERSTHARFWLFSAARLAEIRKALHQRTAQALAAAQAAQETPNDSLSVLSVEEEALLREYYEGQVQDLCKEKNAQDKTHFSQRVMVTALTYFKRFFLKMSIAEENPKHVILVALFLSGKVEEEKITMEDLLKSYAPKLKPENFLELEKRLLDALNYQLVVFSPFRALVGFLQDLHTSCSEHSSAEVVTQLQQLQETGMELIAKALRGDVPLLFSPQQIALSVLRRTARQLAAKVDKPAVDVERWLTERFAFLGDGDEGRDSLLRHLDAVDMQIDRVSTVIAELSLPEAKGRLEASEELRKKVFKLMKAYNTEAENRRLAAEQEESRAKEIAKIEDQERKQLAATGAACISSPHTAAADESFLRKRMRT